MSYGKIEVRSDLDSESAEDSDELDVRDDISSDEEVKGGEIEHITNMLSPSPKPPALGATEVSVGLEMS